MSMGIAYPETKFPKKKKASSLVFLASKSCTKPNLEVGAFVDIKIL